MIICKCGESRWRTLRKGVLYLCRFCGAIREQATGVIHKGERRDSLLEIADASAPPAMYAPQDGIYNVNGRHVTAKEGDRLV